MLYLEDYLEMIEHLPAEVRDSFTQMRELDLSVQNSMDYLDKKGRNFFQKCKRGELQNEEMNAEHETIKKEYLKVIEDADEKVNIATNMHDLVERYIRRLDSELLKFKCELEADHKGITEQLERKVDEQASESSMSAALMMSMGQKENRYYSPMGMNITTGSNNHPILTSSGSYAGLPQTPTSTKENRYRTQRSEKRRASSGGVISHLDKRGGSLVSSPPSTGIMRQVPTGLSPHSVLSTVPSTVASPGGVPGTVAYNLQQLGGPGTNALAAAASQAIVATQQMQQGRRTASLKASYEAINGAGGGPKEFWISRDIANAANVATQNTLQVAGGDKKKKKVTSTLPMSTSPSIAAPSPSSISLSSSSPSLNVDDMLSSAAAAAGVGIPSLGGLPGLPSSTSLIGRSTSYTGTATALTPGSNLTVNENGMYVEQAGDTDWSYDPNEPRYCVCNQVSYGDMVACDNEACPQEWFHYPCVNITQPPKGKWYCPNCTITMKQRRGNRKN